MDANRRRKRFVVPLAVGQRRRGAVPFRGQPVQFGGDRSEFAVGRNRAAARFVGCRIFQLGDQFFLLTFQGGDLHFEIVDALLIFAPNFCERFARFGFGSLLFLLFAQSGFVMVGGADAGAGLSAAGDRLCVR